MIKYKFTAFFTLFMIGILQAQVSFGGKNSIDGESTILDFNNLLTNTNGIIIPAVSNAPLTLTENNNGTFIFDKNDAKVKIYENSIWKDLTSTGSLNAIVTNNSNESLSKQGVIIGSTTSLAEGVLVLESSDKAMILPKINDPHLNVKSPYPGMICFDTNSETLAIFDGKLWHYWK